MPNSIYKQMAGALTQMTKYAERTILFRGKELDCVVLHGDTYDSLVVGGLQGVAVTHVKVLRSVIAAAIGQAGDPKSNELVTFPATPQHGLIPQQFMIKDVIAESFAFSFGLVDPASQ